MIYTCYFMGQVDKRHKAAQGCTPISHANTIYAYKIELGINI